jgi:hypothetical protein
VRISNSFALCIGLVLGIGACAQQSGLLVADSKCSEPWTTVAAYSACLKQNEALTRRGSLAKWAPIWLAASDYVAAEIAAKRMTEEEGKFRLLAFAQQMGQQHAAQEAADTARVLSALTALSNAGAAMSQPVPAFQPPVRLQTTCHQTGKFLTCQ